MDNSGSRRLVTRGNLDGIVSAAVFLNRFPGSPIKFVTSPASAATMLHSIGGDIVYLADLSLTPELTHTVEHCDMEVRVIDHHPSTVRADYATIDTRVSAATLLYRVLEGRDMDDVVALADLYERCDTPLLSAAIARHGWEVLKHEAEVLDFAWRIGVGDDAFRLEAATLLSSGSLPSCHPSILQRYDAMVRGGGWDKALVSVREAMKFRGRIGVLELGKRRRSFHGFGSRALSEVARQEGCKYAIMVRKGRDSSVISLRSVGGTTDLGHFIEDFTKRNGLEGGGHPSSAGARIPSATVPLLLEELEIMA